MMNMKQNQPHNYLRSRSFRDGTILIIVAGMCALLASLALTFLVRNRSDAAESRQVLKSVQARIMLASACNYIQECSRIGWDQYPSTPLAQNDYFPTGSTREATVPVHEETFGWIDVRDGQIGPITQEGRQVWKNDLVLSDGIQKRPLWPAPNSIVRCPMHVWERTKYATSLKVCYNPIETGDTSSPSYLLPHIKNPDPLPAGGYSWNEHAQGNATPRVESAGLAWFRILREGPSTFLITCGAGQTMGFRSYKEASAQGQGDIFNNDPLYFAALAANEIRLWYRVEWSASSAEPTYHWQLHHSTRGVDSYLQWPVNASQSRSYGTRSPAFDKNQTGTFRWIMRLRKEPTYW